MHVVELAQINRFGQLFRCDSMPPNRWRYFGFAGEDLYLRPDGSAEKFAGLMDHKKYHADTTWRSCGFVHRTADGSIDLSRLPVEA